MNPQDLKQILSSGLLSFPVTDFDAAGDFNAKTYTERLEWLAPYGASALFAAGGTGEFFSLTPANTPTSSRHRRRPPAAARCRSWPAPAARRAWRSHYAQEAERLGAHGILLLPHYLTEASQDGLVEHVEQVCKSVKFGVVVYNRGICRLTAGFAGETGRPLPEPDRLQGRHRRHRMMVSIWRRMGDRFSYLGGLPTAEVYAAAYKALGVPVYSSAVFNFMPKLAMDFYTRSPPTTARP
jgi:5-dehydro-4-deoxyglucarate dehydratase